MIRSMFPNKLVKQTTVTPATQSPPPPHTEDEHPKQWPRLLRFLDAFKTEAPAANNMMSWKVEGKEWVDQ